ncbi:hypothetical protein [Nocardioides sp.]|jgi:hypothetical protein|uniref:hypothetical protein n=1 Tax=Nocardioides sp. TaxID=35761 RepID=UPI002F3E575F
MYDVIEHAPPPTRTRPRLAAWTLRIVTAAALSVDAFVHNDLASRYDANQGTGPVSQGDLFRIEAVASVVVALALLISGRWFVWVVALLVAASAVGAVLLYRYHDPGELGPMPDMYEPLWFREKTVAAIAEGIAVVTATLGLWERWWRSRGVSTLS